MVVRNAGVSDNEAMRTKKFRRILLILLVVALIIPTLLALAIFLYGQTDRAVKSDLIIVLGAGTRPSGNPSVAHMRRVQHAASLYKKGMAPLILCTGGFTARNPKSEAGACAGALQQLGIPPSAILMEENSRSTEENAIEAKKVMMARNLATAILISDNYHLWRAEMLFKAQGIQVSLSPAQVTSGPLSWRTALTNTLREVAASGWHFFKTVLSLPITNMP